MTRKQALAKVLDILETEEIDEEIINKIEEIYEETPSCTWTKNRVLDAIEQFIYDNGYFPSRRDFVYPLPNIGTVHTKLGTTSLQEVEYLYFPTIVPYSVNRMKVYHNKIIDDFKKNYERIGNGYYVKQREYDNNRDKDSLTVQTILRNLDIGYNELLAICGFKRIFPKKKFVIKSIENTDVEAIKKISESLLKMI